MNQSEYKIRNLESSILYIQEEYANTIKLLHEEIKELQMKNSELSFQIAMQNVALPSDSISCENQVEKLSLLEQIDELKADIKKLNLENESKSTQLENYKTQVCILMETIGKLKQAQQEQLSVVETELNNKSAEIVLLSTKLHNWKKYEIKRTSFGDQEANLKSQNMKPFVVPQMSVSSKVFKIRNQISVHPDDDNIKRRPIIARHTTISASHPIRNKIIPPIPECAISTEEITNFSKSIKRPNILPPINSMKANFQLLNSITSILPKSSTSDTSVYPQDSFVDSFQTCEVKNYDVSRMRNIGENRDIDKNSSCGAGTVSGGGAGAGAGPINHVQLEHLMDINNSSLVSSPASVKCTLSRNQSS